MFFCAWWSFSSKLISSLVLSVVADGTQSLKNIFSLSGPSSAACLNSEPAFPFYWVPVSALAGVRPYLPIVFTSQIAHPAIFSALSSFSHCHSLWFWSNPCLLSPCSKSWKMSQFQTFPQETLGEWFRVIESGPKISPAFDLTTLFGECVMASSSFGTGLPLCFFLVFRQAARASG